MGNLIEGVVFLVLWIFSLWLIVMMLPFFPFGTIMAFILAVTASKDMFNKMRDRFSQL